MASKTGAAMASKTGAAKGGSARGAPAQDVSLARQVAPYLASKDVMAIGSIIVNAEAAERLDDPEGGSIVDGVLSRQGPNAATINMDALFVASPHAYQGVIGVLKNRLAELDRPGPETALGSDSD